MRRKVKAAITFDDYCRSQGMNPDEQKDFLDHLDQDTHERSGAEWDTEYEQWLEEMGLGFIAAKRPERHKFLRPAPRTRAATFASGQKVIVDTEWGGDLEGTIIKEIGNGWWEVKLADPPRDTIQVQQPFIALAADRGMEGAPEAPDTTYSNVHAWVVDGLSDPAEKQAFIQHIEQHTKVSLLSGTEWMKLYDQWVGRGRPGFVEGAMAKSETMTISTGPIKFTVGQTVTAVDPVFGTVYKGPIVVINTADRALLIEDPTHAQVWVYIDWLENETTSSEAGEPVHSGPQITLDQWISDTNPADPEGFRAYLERLPEYHGEQTWAATYWSSQYDKFSQSAMASKQAKEQGGSISAMMWMHQIGMPERISWDVLDWMVRQGYADTKTTPQRTAEEWDTYYQEYLTSAGLVSEKAGKRTREEIDPRDVEAGDLVDFGPFGQLYVVNTGYREGWWWATDDESQRHNPNAPGHSIQPELAVTIIEKWDDEEEFLTSKRTKEAMDLQAYIDHRPNDDEALYNFYAWANQEYADKATVFELDEWDRLYDKFQQEHPPTGAPTIVEGKMRTKRTKEQGIDWLGSAEDLTQWLSTVDEFIDQRVGMVGDMSDEGHAFLTKLFQDGWTEEEAADEFLRKFHPTKAGQRKRTEQDSPKVFFLDWAAIYLDPSETPGLEAWIKSKGVNPEEPKEESRWEQYYTEWLGEEGKATGDLWSAQRKRTRAQEQTVTADEYARANMEQDASDTWLQWLEDNSYKEGSRSPSHWERLVIDWEEGMLATWRSSFDSERTMRAVTAHEFTDDYPVSDASAFLLWLADEKGIHTGEDSKDASAWEALLAEWEGVPEKEWEALAKAMALLQTSLQKDLGGELTRVLENGQVVLENRAGERFTVSLQGGQLAIEDLTASRQYDGHLKDGTVIATVTADNKQQAQRAMFAALTGRRELFYQWEEDGRGVKVHKPTTEAVFDRLTRSGAIAAHGRDYRPGPTRTVIDGLFQADDD